MARVPRRAARDVTAPSGAQRGKQHSGQRSRRALLLRCAAPCCVTLPAARSVTSNDERRHRAGVAKRAGSNRAQGRMGLVQLGWTPSRVCLGEGRATQFTARRTSSDPETETRAGTVGGETTVAHCADDECLTCYRRGVVTYIWMERRVGTPL